MKSVLLLFSESLEKCTQNPAEMSNFPHLLGLKFVWYFLKKKVYWPWQQTAAILTSPYLAIIWTWPRITTCRFLRTRKKWRLRRHFCSLRLPMETSSCIKMAPELHPDSWIVRKKFQRTHFTIPNNIFSMTFPLKLVPGLADVGVLQGDGDGDSPRTPPRWLEGSGKSFKWLFFFLEIAWRVFIRTNTLNTLKPGKANYGSSQFWDYTA